MAAGSFSRIAVVDGENEVHRYGRAFERLTEMAPNPDESTRLVERRADEL